MKKTLSLIIMAAGLIAAGSCAKEKLQAPTGENLVKVSFRASLEASKAELDAGKVNWQNGDKIAVWDGTAKQIFTASGVDGQTAFFSGEVTEGATEFYVVYPSSALSKVASETFTVTVPAVQNIAAGAAIDTAALVMTGYTADLAAGVNMKNSVSLAKFTVDIDDITSVVLFGNDGEKFVGTATVDKTGETVTCSGSTKLTVKKDDGSAFAAGDYYAAIAPTTFEGGVTIASSVTGGKTVFTTAKKAEFLRNAGKNFGAFASRTDKVVLVDNIMTAEQLVAFGQNANVYAAGETVTLGADIDLAYQEWVPVVLFDGNFDGQGHAVKGIRVESKANACFFYKVTGDVSNLSFGSPEESDTSVFRCIADTTANCFAAPIAYPSGSSNITNVTNYATVEGRGPSSYYNAGVVAAFSSNGTVSGCKNYGTVKCTCPTGTATHTNIAGVVSSCSTADATIIDCTNYGYILFNPSKNNGSINFGGVVAYAAAEFTIKNCTNEGALELGSDLTGGAESHIGGVLGYSNTTAMKEFSGNVNKGTVTDNAKTFSGQKTYLGGVVGYLNAASPITDCINEGVVTNHTYTTYPYVGGIVGFVNKEGTISGCINKALVLNTGNSSHSSPDTLVADIAVGGIAGRVAVAATISGCENQAEVTNSGHAKNNNKTGHNFTSTGGIIGAVTSGATAGVATVVKDCINRGAVTDSSALTAKTKTNVGGCIGSNHSNGAITNCDNFAPVLKCASGAAASTTLYVGGIIGYLYAYTGNKAKLSDLSGCDNSGDVSCTAATSASSYVGGCIGSWCSTGSFPMSNFTNSGTVTNTASTSTVYIGGIVGNVGNGSYTTHSLTATYSGCVNNGNVTLSSNSATVRIAGIAASHYGLPTFDGCTNNGNITLQCKAKSKTIDMGGMIGKNTGSTGKFTGCTNTGTITCLDCALTTATIAIAGLMGNGKGSPFTDCVNSGRINVDNGSVNVTKIMAGGLYGYASAATTVKGGSSNQAVTTTSATTSNVGAALGLCDKAPTITLLGVGGSVNGTALASDNWTTLLYGKVSDNTGIDVSGGENSCYLITE